MDSINDYLADQKSDLTFLGIPGYMVTIDNRIWSIRYEKFRKIQKDGTIKFQLSPEKIVIYNIRALWRYAFSDSILQVSTDDQMNLSFIGYPNYSITRSGRVWNHVTHLYMVLKNNRGYREVNLTRDKKATTVKVHRLVALAFKPNPENKPEVNHKDGNKSNNFDWNLEWSTHPENMEHAWELGLRTRVTECPHCGGCI